jgi:hypothetical protein
MPRVSLILVWSSFSVPVDTRITRRDTADGAEKASKPQAGGLCHQRPGAEVAIAAPGPVLALNDPKTYMRLLENIRILAPF